MQILTQEGELIGQFGEQKRKPLTYEEIPSQFIEALMAAEDDGFLNIEASILKDCFEPYQS